MVPVASQALSDAFVTFAEGCFNQFSVHAMLQDKRGFIWFCTQDGIVRHDGSQWRTISSDDGLTHPHVWSIVEDPTEPYTFWLGTAGAGICRYRPEAATVFESFAQVGNEVHALTFDQQGRLWCASETGVSIHTDKQLETGPASSLFVAKDGRIWAGFTNGRIRAWDPHTLEAVITVEAKGPVACIMQDRADSLWFGMNPGGLLRIDGNGEQTTFTTQDGLPHPQVVAALCDSEGELWFCTWGGGVSHVKQRSFGRRLVFATLTQNDGLGANAVQSIFEDRSHRLWFGTVGAGATCMTPARVRRPKFFQNFSTREGLGNNMVACIGHDAKDRFWFGCFSGGVTQYDPMSPRTAWRVIGSKEGLPHETVRGIASDSKGRIWFATPGAGLAAYDPQLNHWRYVRVKDGLASDITRWITPTPDGLFWVSTDAGVTCFNPLDMTGFKTVADGSVMHVLDHGDDLYFVYTTAGLTKYNRATGATRHYGEEDGLQSQHLIMAAKDGEGRVWVATNGQGVACLEGERFRHYSVNEGLPHPVVYSVLVHNEQVWGSTVRGVFRIVGDRITSFDRSDGLGGDECNGRAALRDRTGRLWFGNTGGASWIAPNDVPVDAPPAAVFVTAMTTRALNGTPQVRPLTHGGAIKAYEFIFEYTAVEFVSPQKVEYRFRLRGLEDEWVRRTQDRSVRYTNLAPGDYVFETQARNWTGQWSQPATLAFTVG